MTDGSGTSPRKFTDRHRPHSATLPDRQRTAERAVADSSIAVRDLIPRLRAFLDLVVREMALAMAYEISTESGSEHDGGERQPAEADGNAAQKSRVDHADDGLLVRFSGEDEEILLSHNGELLLALEYLAHRWLRLPPALHDHVRFECGEFRANRLEELKLSARVAAQRVRETGQAFSFNPMSSRDRRIIHLELNGAVGVRTMSEGSGDHRHLVIYPAASPSRK
jgi:predicted RNA-binding protein Jag